jgi:hypothetical protein
MRTPFAKYRPIGPFITLPSTTNAPIDRGMVSGQQTPCDKILNQKEDVMREMMQRTRDTEYEHAAIFVETQDKILATDIEKGKEDAITNVTLANLSMDATMLAINEQGGGKIDPTTYKTHQVHTHPSGHVDMSLRDTTQIGNNMNADNSKNMPHAHLVAVDRNDETVLHGLYRDRPLTKDEINTIRAYSSTMEADQYMGITDRKSEMVDVLLDNGFKVCSSSTEL